MPTVLVTGANRGLGLEFTRQYADAGWNVIACARTPDAAKELAEVAGQAGGRVERHALDVANHSSIEHLSERLAGRPIDVLINSAGTMSARSFAKEGLAVDSFGGSDFSDWERVFKINTIGPMMMAETFVRQVGASTQKKIVNLSSVLSSMEKNTIGGLYSYRATKAALNAVSKSLAIDLGKKHGIIVAPVHPGWVKTDMGGANADIDATESIRGLRAVIEGLTLEKSGRLWMYDGSELPW